MIDNVLGMILRGDFEEQSPQVYPSIWTSTSTKHTRSNFFFVARLERLGELDERSSERRKLTVVKYAE